MGRKFQDAASKLLDVMRRSWLKKHGVPLPAPTMTAQQRAEIQECFEMLDTDSSGALDVREIIHAFGALGFTISKDAIEELMKEADPDGSGELEFDEFLSLMGRALYQPDDRGLTLVAKTGSGDLSFADVVRAFRRKKLIESLIRGGDARLKVVEFHEKVQDLIRTETQALRQRQNTHAIFERMENDKAEREKLSKVAEVLTSQRSQKMKAKLQDAIGRSLGVFESLYKRHHSSSQTGDAASPPAADGSGSRSGSGSGSEGGDQLRESADGAASSPILGARSTLPAPPRAVSFLTQLHAESSAGVLQGLDLRAKRGSAAQSMEFTRPAVRSMSTVVDGPQSRRVSTAVLNYFKQLEKQAKKVEFKYDEAARVNASLVPPPPDRSEFNQALMRPMPPRASGGPNTTNISIAAGVVASQPASASTATTRLSSGGSRRVPTSPSSASGMAGAGSATGRPPGATTRLSSSSGSAGVASASGCGSPLPEAAGGGGGVGGGAARPRSSVYRPQVPSSGMEGRRSARGQQPRQTGPITPAWAEFVAAAAAVGSGASAAAAAAAVMSPPPPAAVSPPPVVAPQPAAAAASAAAAAAVPALNTTLMASRAWRQAPSFGPAGAVAASAFGWGSGVSPVGGAAMLRSSGSCSPAGLAPHPRSSRPGSGANAATAGVGSPGSETSGNAGTALETVGDLWASWPEGQQVAAAAARVFSGRDPHRPRPGSGGITPLPPVPGSAGASAQQDAVAAAAVRSRSPSPAGQPPPSAFSVATWNSRQASGGGSSYEAQSASAGSGPAPEAQTSRSTVVSSGLATAAGSGGGGVLGQQAPGPITRAWLAQGRPRAESHHTNYGGGGGGSGRLQAALLSHTRSMPLNGGAALGQRSFRNVGAESTRRQASISTTGIATLGGAGGASSGAAGGPVNDRVRPSNSFSHGPFRSASRGPAGMGSAFGPAAAALMEGLVSVSPAPGLAPTTGYVVPGLASGPPGGGGASSARPRELSRYARAGTLPIAADFDAGGSAGRGGGRSGSGSGESDSYSNMGTQALLAASRADWGSESGGSASRRSTAEGTAGPSCQSPVIPPLAVAAAAAAAAAAAFAASDSGAGGGAWAAAASEAGAPAATAASAASTVDGGMREDAAATASRRSTASGGDAKPSAPTESQLPSLSPRSGTRIGGSVALAPGAVSPFLVIPPSSDSFAPKPDARDGGLALRPFNSLPMLKSGLGDAARSPRAEAAAAVAAAAAAAVTASPTSPLPPKTPAQPTALPPSEGRAAAAVAAAALSRNAPADSGYEPQVLSPKSISGPSAATAAAAAAAAAAAPVAVFPTHSTYIVTGGASIVSPSPAASPPAAANPTPPPTRSRGGSGGPAGGVAYVGPRGAYMSLQLASQRGDAAQSNRSPRRGGGGSSAGAARSPASGLKTSATEPPPPSRPTPLADRVVVTFFGQPLPRARNGAVILPAVGSQPPSYPPELQQAAAAANAALPPSYPRPWAGVGPPPSGGIPTAAAAAAAAAATGGFPSPSPMATTAATAAAWLTGAGGPPSWPAAMPPNASVPLPTEPAAWRLQSPADSDMRPSPP